MQDAAPSQAVPSSLPALSTRALDAEHLGPAAEEALRELRAEGSCENTTRSYRTGLRYWAAWFFARYRMPIALPAPQAAVLQFILDHAGRTSAIEIVSELPVEIDQALVKAGFKAKLGPLAMATLTHRVSVLSRAHTLAGGANPCQSPEVRDLLSRTKRAYAKRGEVARKKPALTRAPLEAVLDTCDDSVRGKRDRAILLFAWASGGRRRSEVALATHERLHCEDSGYIYELGASKTNQASSGRPEDQKPLAGVAADALRAWVDASGHSTGPLFRRIGRDGRVRGGLSPSAVRDIVKARCAAAGLPASFSPHSLRSGFVTEAGRQGVALGETMALSGHRSLTSVSGYHRAGAALNSPAARLLEGHQGSRHPEPLASTPPRLILDKNFVQGAKKEVIVALCRDGRAVMPDVLFYEMLTGGEPGRSRCFAKFLGENPVTLVRNAGELLQYETARHRACGKPSRHALGTRFQFNPKLAAGVYELPDEAKATLREEDERLRGELASLIEMINMAPTLFPDAFDKERDRLAERKKYENALANDPNEIVEFYARLEPPEDSVKPAPAALLTDEWIHFRWLQVKLWASLDLRIRLGRLEGELVGERRHRLENFLLDMQYAMLATLEGGLASEDDWLRSVFKLFRPDGVLLPTDAEMAAKRAALKQGGQKMPLRPTHDSLHSNEIQ